MQSWYIVNKRDVRYLTDLPGRWMSTRIAHTLAQQAGAADWGTVTLPKRKRQGVITQVKSRVKPQVKR